MRYRATIYYLSASAAAVEGDAAIQRYVVEHEAESLAMFRADILDQFIQQPDDEVTFGPITEKPS